MLLCLACSGSPDSGIEQGHWVGEVVSFYVVGDELRDILVMRSACTGEDSFGKACATSINNELSGHTLTIDGNKDFSGLLFDDGTRRFAILTGVFPERDLATGIYQFLGTGCCAGTGDFEVRFEQPAVGPAPLADAAESVDATPVGDEGVLVAKGVDPITSECPEGYQSTTYGGCSPQDAESFQLDALTEINRIRAYVGIQPLNAHTAINRAALAHCECFVAHYQDVYQAQSMNPHQEDPSFDDCVAKDFSGRMTHFGYPGSPSYEIMGFMADPIGAAHGWLETLYHRIPILDPNSYDMGYGMATSGETGCDTGDFSTFDEADESYEAIYPVHGQTGVATRWLGYENPQPPLPEGAEYPSGPIITLIIPRGVHLVVDEYALVHSDGAEVPVAFTSPANNERLKRTTALYALDPLDAMTTYTVSLAGTKGSASWSRTWSFTTGPDGEQWDYRF